MRKYKFVAVLLCLSFVLTACGARGASTTINVTFTDFHFTPESFTVPAGQEITVNAVNNGAVVHNFVIMKYGTTVGDNYGPEDDVNIFWKLETQPGDNITAKFTAPTDPGDYQVICVTPGHYQAGMVAKLTVVAGK